MRRMTLLLASVALAGGGTLTVFACGGSDDPVPAAAPDAATATSTSSSGAGTSSGTDPGTSSGSSGNTEAGTTTSSGGALAAQPAQIACGTELCDAGGFGAGGFTQSFICCGRDAGAASTCIRSQLSGQCDNSTGQKTIQLNCDETADCPKFGGGAGAQQKCCYRNGGGETRTECRSACVTGGGATTPIPQVCRTNEECGDAGACSEKTCDGFKLHVCGSPAGCQ